MCHRANPHFLRRSRSLSLQLLTTTGSWPGVTTDITPLNILIYFLSAFIYNVKYVTLVSYILCSLCIALYCTVPFIIVEEH
uniref:Uncharacterized protein n=1 Tax=Anguilla anguilla TaxID=7936 RepID=A0A0E9XP66_ANGAN